MRTVYKDNLLQTAIKRLKKMALQTHRKFEGPMSLEEAYVGGNLRFQ